MTNSESTVDVCATECGATCCSGGAFLRPPDTVRLRAAGHGKAIPAEGFRTRTDATGDCVLLGDDNRCQAYNNRPLDCRLFPVGFVLDDDDCVVHIVLVSCPLSENLPDETKQAYVQAAKSVISDFSASSLRTYDELSFTAEYDRLATIPYDALEVNL